jgi:hypothetical protein
MRYVVYFFISDAGNGADLFDALVERRISSSAQNGVKAEGW